MWLPVCFDVTEGTREVCEKQRAVRETISLNFPVSRTTAKYTLCCARLKRPVQMTINRQARLNSERTARDMPLEKTVANYFGTRPKKKWSKRLRLRY